mgnify:CR=1 FL=1
MAKTSNLIESGTRRYVGMMLVRSHEFRRRHTNILFNAGLGAALFGLVALVLYYKRRTRENQAETDIRLFQKRNYVLDKLNNYNKTVLSVDGAFHTPQSANSDAHTLNVMPEAAGHHAEFHTSAHVQTERADQPGRARHPTHASDWYNSMRTHQSAASAFAASAASASAIGAGAGAREDDYVIPRYSSVNAAVEASLYL